MSCFSSGIARWTRGGQPSALTAYWVTSGKVLSPGKAAIIDSIRGKDAMEIIDAVRRGSAGGE
jgi:hypothetical protein